MDLIISINPNTKLPNKKFENFFDTGTLAPIIIYHKHKHNMGLSKLMKIKNNVFMQKPISNFIVLKNIHVIKT